VHAKRRTRHRAKMPSTQTQHAEKNPQASTPFPILVLNCSCKASKNDSKHHCSEIACV
jgi:hypothetical protein